MVISLWLMAAMPMNEPTSIMSGRMRWFVPYSFSTPWIRNKFEPTPSMNAPMRLSILHNCCR